MSKRKLIIAVFGLFMTVITALYATPRKPAVSKEQFLGLPVVNGVVGQNAEIAFVSRVVDGDTIDVQPVDAVTGVFGKQETVRYIGMDTPETVSPSKPVECYGHEASARNKELVEGKYVALIKDKGDKDKYGRLLRFVYLVNEASGTISTGTFINLELVNEGMARVLSVPPNTALAPQFMAAAVAAQSAKLGFWGNCSSSPFK